MLNSLQWGLLRLQKNRNASREIVVVLGSCHKIMYAENCIKIWIDCWRFMFNTLQLYSCIYLIFDTSSWLLTYTQSWRLKHLLAKYFIRGNCNNIGNKRPQKIISANVTLLIISPNQRWEIKISKFSDNLRLQLELECSYDFLTSISDLVRDFYILR